MLKKIGLPTFEPVTTKVWKHSLLTDFDSCFRACSSPHSGQKTKMRLKIKTTLFSIVLYLGNASVALPVPQHHGRVIADNFQAICGCLILTSLNTTANAVIAQELLQNISDSLDTSDQAKCNSWNGDPGYEIEIFADQFGKPTKNLNGSAGVFAPDIYAFCGPPELGQVFHYLQFHVASHPPPSYS